MKSHRTKVSVSLLLLLVLLIGLSSCGNNDWKRRKFRSYEEMAAAFKYAKYNDVVAEFGKPNYKFLDIENEIITYRWDGVGVNGSPDAYIDFNLIEYQSGFFKGFEFVAVSSIEGERVPSNDNRYHID
jgi:hypothetical protein